jgi:hypothetical protein
MRPLQAALAAGALGLGLSVPAIAVDPVKPEIGGGPHIDRSAQTSGAGDTKRDASQPLPPGQPAGGGAGAGAGPQGSGASTGPSRPDTVQDQEDERKATQAKEKMKKKPGYQEDVPSPRASHTGLAIN